ncbi:MAG: hypothetical protein J6Y82_05110 [Bacteroidales bacterium]|nr:hypothetical protein [Bacteroidales bacterium]
MYKYNEEQPMPPVEQYPAAVRDSALRQSHRQLGFVYEKIDDEYYRHFLRVGIADSLTTLHEFYETDRLYAKAYKRISVGDTVIVRTADAMPQINQVVNWRPTQSEIQKCRIPAPYTATATQNHTQAFIDSVMQQSHEQLGFVFDKYEDEHVGAYLEVGVSDTLTRTYLFYRYKKPYTKVFKTTSIGDTVMLRVSDSYPQINQVVKWKYVKEEEEKPANVAAPKESAESERNASIVDKGIETDFAIVYTKGINSVWPKYFVKLKYNNTVSDYIGIDDIYKKQIYESISAGDTVIIQKPKSNSEKIQVLSWRPLPKR